MTTTPGGDHHNGSGRGEGEAEPPAGRYLVDAAASRVDFRTRHMFGLGPVRGSFPVAGGEFTVRAPLEGSVAEGRIDVRGLDTGSAGRDRTVRSARLLDADRYPEITFSAGCPERNAAGDGWVVGGRLGVRGVEREIGFAVREVRVDGERVTVRLAGRVDRYAFGVTGYRGTAARHLDLDATIVAVARPSAAFEY